MVPSASRQSPKVSFPSLAPPLIFTCRKLSRRSTSGIEKVGPDKMAAPLELSCWGGGWGLPSVHSESLVVMVRPPLGPGGQKGRGQRRQVAGPVPAAGSGSLPGRGRRGAARCTFPGSLRLSYHLACETALRRGRRPTAFPLGSELLFSSLQSYLGGGLKAPSRGRGKRTPSRIS